MRLDIEHLCKQIQDQIDIDIKRAYLIGSFASEKDIDTDSRSDIDFYIQPEDNKKGNIEVDYIHVRTTEGENLGEREVDINTFMDLPESVNNFEDGLDRFPERIRLESLEQ